MKIPSLSPPLQHELLILLLYDKLSLINRDFLKADRRIIPTCDKDPRMPIKKPPPYDRDF